MGHLRTQSIEAQTELQARQGARSSLIEFTRFTFPGYTPGNHHHVIAHYLQQLTFNRMTNDGIMIFMPPRHGKSELVDIRWPAYDLGHKPEGHFIGTAYGDSLANTFSRACRNVIRGSQYQRLWPRNFKLENDKRWEIERENDDQRASYIAVGILGSMTGEGATRLLVDDPVKNAEEAYSEVIRQKTYDNYLTAASTRMAPKGKKVLVMTRWHEDDLAGRLLRDAQQNPKADQWTVLCFAATNEDGTDSYIWDTRTGVKRYMTPYKALWPDQFDVDHLEKTRATLGEVYWSALYMQRPQAAVGGIFKRNNWAEHDGIGKLDYIIQVYDTAFAEGQENDYSATIDLGSAPGCFPVLDAWRGKVSFPDLVQRVYERWDRALARYGRCPDRILVENKGSGISLIQQIEANNLAGVYVFPNGRPKRVPKIPVFGMPATVSKVVRAQGISGYHEAKLISLPKGQIEWKNDFVDECALFPKGPHDDWVDTLVHGVTWYSRPVEESEGTVTLDNFGPEMQYESALGDFEFEDDNIDRFLR
jgi:predicted phage terminase large subunit-like protein